MTIYCDYLPVIETEYRDFEGATPSELIIDAIAKAEGVDPLELEPLYDIIDPTTIDSLFTRPGTPPKNEVALSFKVENSLVNIHSDGRILICDTTQTVEPYRVFEPGEAESEA